jgi:copper chaperone
MRETLKLTIDGMHCEGCVRRVTAVLEGIRTVTPAQVEVGSAMLTYDPDQATVEEIASAIHRVGFSARVRSEPWNR